ncbi:GNAT family N-acetyltransferase [Curtobacterium pusillum]|uniref:GNAT family N-acetyltransferase n=1 Tax=Curtobacterium pusillum TaxID=69373 RepID=UPI0037F8C4BA
MSRAVARSSQTLVRSQDAVPEGGRLPGLDEALPGSSSGLRHRLGESRDRAIGARLIRGCEEIQESTSEDSECECGFGPYPGVSPVQECEPVVHGLLGEPAPRTVGIDQRPTVRLNPQSKDRPVRFGGEPTPERQRRGRPQRETTLIAEVGDERVGSVMVAPYAEGTAQLRVLLVTPGARGLGVATRLIDEALAFALRAGYRKVTLWTSSNLTAARRRYERAGFHLESESPALLFGTAVDEQTWAIEL